ncbi:hypothetical protein BC939DRAFT_331392 [Gamsiella multidivaricata]|uniref:uncharacterized protein n=1 Tax=Gamsiella multidivaricata TaxID=101098 RepID=UPI0022204BA9|nr:uncharacterized protein BC939DRAFT_331392 [Gamsiella multidivaricata]KAI7817340.1 hypothetical protein BC939DRAFT_331392 [Gamsiella multidivaricata]
MWFRAVCSESCVKWQESAALNDGEQLDGDGSDGGCFERSLLSTAGDQGIQVDARDSLLPFAPSLRQNHNQLTWTTDMDRDPDQCGRSSPTIPLGSTESSLQQYLHRETAAGNSLEKRSGEDSMISTTKALQSQAQVQLPSLPPTSSSTTALNDPDGEIPEAPSATAAEHTEVDQQPMAPRPLAVKPAYKKRVVISSSSPDETTKRSGLIEATERCMLGRHHFEKRMRLGGSIYDRPPIVAAIPPQEQQQQKLIMKPKVPRPPKPPSKKKMTRPPQIWRPTEFKESGTRARSRSIIRPVMREGSIESLVKLTKFHKDRLAQLSTRPLPLQDLQTLIHAEQEQEHLVLTDLAVRLHKELLKLQLEEGVLLKMLQLSESGLLDASDLERVRPRKRRKSKELEAQTRARLRAINRPVSTAFSSTAMDGSGLASDGHTQMRAQDLSRSLLSPPIGCGVHRDITAISSGSPLADLTDVAVNESERGGTWGSAYQEAAEERAFHDSRDEPERGNRHQDVYIEGRYSNEDNDDSEDCDDDDDDDDDDDNDDDSDDICDVYDGDEHENEPVFRLPRRNNPRPA